MAEIRIIGVPMDLGSGRRGVDMGPSAIRIGRLSSRLTQLNLHVEDLGNVDVPVPEEVPHGRIELMYLVEIGKVCVDLARRVRTCLDEGRMPLVLGGDHSLSAGSVGGVSSHFRQRNQRIGLIWVDAHGDMNVPETSSSGNVHGMPLAALLGLGPRELVEIEGFSPKVAVENAAVIGVRSLDGEEKRTIRKIGLRVITMSEIDKRGMRSAVEEAIQVATHGTAGFHCSFDLDVIDPQEAPGVGTPVPGGITYREGHLAMEMIHDSQQCCSLEFVEVNPILDSENRTGRLAVDLACSALGKRIL